MMTKKHFIAAALIVRSILAGNWTNDLPSWASPMLYGGDEVGSARIRAIQTAEAFICLAITTSPRFNRQRFLAACGLIK